MTQTFQVSGAVTLDSSGNGTATIPTGGGDWVITGVTVNVSTAVNQPIAQLYRNVVAAPNLVGASYTGANDTAGGRIVLQQGGLLLCKWTGGDAGARATVTANVVQYPAGQAPAE